MTGHVLEGIVVEGRSIVNDVEVMDVIGECKEKDCFGISFGRIGKIILEIIVWVSSTSHIKVIF